MLCYDQTWVDFFQYAIEEEKTREKPHPLITMPLVMLVTALQLHFQSCWRLSTVIPCHSIQRSSNLIGIFLSSWWSSTSTFYVLWEDEHFGSLTSLSRPRIPFFSVKRGGEFLRQPICRISCHENRQFSSYFAKELHQDRGSACYSKGGGPVFNQMAIQSFQTFVADCDCDLMYCI